MDQLRSLPFKVGDRVETKSFKEGYRGAWFRCEIKEASKKGVALQYIDYPDEGIEWRRSVYDKPRKSKSAKVELMLRPPFPRIYREGEAPDVNTLSEVSVVTNGVWKVGDLVDILWNGAYWSSTITEVLGDDKVQVQSTPEPFGEGTIDEVLREELRPSLEWSRTSGWKLPVPKGTKNYHPCARLIKPVNQGKLRNEGETDSEAVAAKESPLELNASASPSSAHSLPSEKGSGIQTPQKERRAEGKKKDVDTKGSCSDSVSSSTFARASAEEVAGQTFCEHTPENDEAPKRVKLNTDIPLNSSTCDSMGSMIADMEELLNRVKWMKRILEPELPESDQAGWKFQEYRAGGKKAGPD